MWQYTHTRTVKGVAADQLWRVWSDVNQWHTWQSDIDYARLDGAFAVGNTFTLKPKGGPKLKIQIVRAEPGRAFTDLTRFPGARMYGAHEFVACDDGLEIRTTLRIEGPLSFIWRKIVAEDIAKGEAEQTERLIERATRV